MVWVKQYVIPFLTKGVYMEKLDTVLAKIEELTEVYYQMGVRKHPPHIRIDTLSFCMRVKIADLLFTLKALDEEGLIILHLSPQKNAGAKRKTLLGTVELNTNARQVEVWQKQSMERRCF